MEDVQAGKAAGYLTIFVNYGLVRDEPAEPDKTVTSLQEATEFILKRASAAPAR